MFLNWLCKAQFWGGGGEERESLNTQDLEITV